jgi:hypothetical protein
MLARRESSFPEILVGKCPKEEREENRKEEEGGGKREEAKEEVKEGRRRGEGAEGMRVMT